MDNCMTDNDNLVFAQEERESTDYPVGKLWKLLVVDDDAFVHKVTNMVLKDYQFEGRGLDTIEAYSAEEGKCKLLEHSDIAVILLDVVMETPHAGLELAQWIRNDLKNEMVRIILRTGQPGEAPEREVIFEYDINDYKEKAELTSLKLATTVTTAIRSYRDILTIERNRVGLARIVESSPTIFKTQSMGRFASGVLSLLSSTISFEDNSIMARASGIAASKNNGQFEIIASTGTYEKARGHSLDSIGDQKAIDCIRQAYNKKQNCFSGDSFAGYYRTSSGSENIIYLSGYGPISESNQSLIKLFSANISVAFDNIDQNKALAETQQELLFTLGEVVETRSSKTGNHVHRFAEYSYLLARKMGMPREQAECLRLASPMHDVGKIGIPDTILLKPGRLDDEEFDIIKRHTTIGHDILKDSNRPVLQTAALVALQHHERWDGSGYPQGLKGEAISLEGRIAILADIFDALSSPRVYREAWPMNEVLAYIKDNSGSIFDPRVVTVFLDNLDRIMEIRETLPGK